MPICAEADGGFPAPRRSVKAVGLRLAISVVMSPTSIATLSMPGPSIRGQSSVGWW